MMDRTVRWAAYVGFALMLLDLLLLLNWQRLGLDPADLNLNWR